MSFFWNSNERRLRAFWRLLGTVFFILVLTAVSAFVLTELGVSPVPVPPYIGQLHSNIFVVVGILLAIRFLDRRKFSDSGMQLNADWWIDLGFGLVLGVHITWNFFLGNVFGFPVSGTNLFPTTFAAIEQNSHEAWSGGDFGPEGGLIGLLAIVLGICFVTVWVRIRYGELTLARAIAKPLERQLAVGDEQRI